MRKCSRCGHELGEWAIYIETDRGAVCGDCIVTEGLRVARPEQRKDNVVYMTRKKFVVDDETFTMKRKTQ